MKFIKFLKDMAATVGQRLKYGAESGAVVEIGIAASKVFKANSARFVTLDSSGFAEPTGAASTTIFGSLEGIGDLTASATAGATVAQCNLSLDTIYRVPIGAGTMTQALIGTLVDLAESAGTQTVDMGTSTRDHLIVVGGDIANNKWVLVKINGAKQPK